MKKTTRFHGCGPSKAATAPKRVPGPISTPPVTDEEKKALAARCRRDLQRQGERVEELPLWAQNKIKALELEVGKLFDELFHQGEVHGREIDQFRTVEGTRFSSVSTATWLDVTPVLQEAGPEGRLELRIQANDQIDVRVDSRNEVRVFVKTSEVPEDLELSPVPICRCSGRSKPHPVHSRRCHFRSLT